MSQAQKETFPPQTETEINRQTIAAELTAQIRLAGLSFCTDSKEEAYAHQAEGQEVAETLYSMGYELEVSVPFGAVKKDSSSIQPGITLFRARSFYFMPDKKDTKLKFANPAENLTIMNESFSLKIVERADHTPAER